MPVFLLPPWKPMRDDTCISAQSFVAQQLYPTSNLHIVNTFFSQIQIKIQIHIQKHIHKYKIHKYQHQALLLSSCIPPATSKHQSANAPIIIYIHSIHTNSFVSEIRVHYMFTEQHCMDYIPHYRVCSFQQQALVRRVKGVRAPHLTSALGWHMQCCICWFIKCAAARLFPSY